MATLPNARGAADGKQKKQGSKITVASAAASLAEAAKQQTSIKEEPQTGLESLGKLELFTKFYKEIGIVPDTEWNAFFKAMTAKPPVTFRMVESYKLCPSHIDTVPGVPSQARVLVRYFQNKFFDALNQLKLGDKETAKLSQIQWYPKELGWELNIGKEDTDKFLSLKEFDMFLKTEKMQNTIQRLETWSMFPPLLLELKPQFTVLDMCAAPGFMASQVLEMMNADPLQAQNGLLILNDLFRANDKMHYHWTQGSKVVYTFFDARNYPDLYFREEKSYNNELKYDRVLCDVKCSSDGTMRKNTSIQEQWSHKAGLVLYDEQKAILRRAVELVKVKGRVLYSTTSLNPIENEAVIAAVLEEAKGSVLLMDCSRLISNFKVRPGLKTWQVMNNEGFFLDQASAANDEFLQKYPASVFPPTLKEANAFHLERCVRVYPHDNDTAGFFCAILVKNTEVPWLQAKILAEITAKKASASKRSKASEEPPAPATRQYGYTIRLKSHVTATEIEWTTENTDEKLNTKTTISVQKCELPPNELDPLCKPRQLIPQVDDNFTFCERTTEEWLKIKEFFKISDDFDPTTMIMRHNRTVYFQSCPAVKTLIQYNRNLVDSNFSAAVGVCLFFAMPDLWIKLDTTVKTMMSHEGLAFLYPFIGKQLVNIDSDDLLKLAFYERVKIDTLSEAAQADLKETEQGCVLFVYRPKYMSSQPNCNITFVGARGENWCLHYKDGKTSEWKNTFRLAGIERVDYGRKIQEEKLVAALEKDKKVKEEQNKEAEKMQT